MIDPELPKAYAEVVIRTGVNLRVGQCLLINTGAGTYDFARTIADAAYRCGAKFVRIMIIDNHLTASRLRYGKAEDLDWLPNFVLTDSYEYLAEDWARIRIDNTEELDALKDVDPNDLTRLQTASRTALRLQQEALMRDQHSWLVICAPGPEWARHIFTHSGAAHASAVAGLNDEQLTERLWEHVTPILRLDKPEPIQAWAEHMDALRERCKKIDELKLDGLRFVNSKTDLFVGLNAESLWRGGSGILPDGRPFIANLPTEEVYTTPDYRRTRGLVQACRPVNVMETQVRDAWFEFDSGKVVKCGASSGTEVLRKFIEIDEGAAYLGEVALVAGDSPIFTSGLIFGSILFDENASCHIALGAGYPSCLASASRLTTPQLVREAGCNVSLVHTDFMIGTPETNVFGVTLDGHEIPLIHQGSFVI